ncbi:hypothetical protein D3C80_1524180 [compost metagenome]
MLTLIVEKLEAIADDEVQGGGGDELVEAAHVPAHQQKLILRQASIEVVHRRLPAGLLGVGLIEGDDTDADHRPEVGLPLFGGGRPEPAQPEQGGTEDEAAHEFVAPGGGHGEGDPIGITASLMQINLGADLRSATMERRPRIMDHGALLQ